MNKLRKFTVFTLTFAIILSSLFLFSCKDKQEKPASNLLNGFESFVEINQLNYLNYFGKVALNKDSNFITQGNGSIKVCATGDTNITTLNPIMEMPLKNSERDYSDITKLKNISLDLYNASDKECNMYLYIRFDSRDLATQKQQVKLAPNEWQNVVFYFDAQVAALLFDLEKGGAFCLEFTVATLPSDIYIDNVVIDYNALDASKTEIVLDENEICSFDKLYQQFLVLPGGVGNVAGIEPILSLNTDLNYSKKGYSLKAILPAGKISMNTWPHFDLSEKLFDKANLGQYGNDALLSFDVYNDSAVSAPIYITYYRKSYDEGRPFYLGAIAPKAWTSFSISFAEINALDGDTTRITADLKKIRIGYYEFLGDDRTLYFDSFRVIKP